MHLFTQEIIPIDAIIVTDRARTEFTDIDVLARTMDDIGIISSIAVKRIVPAELPQPEKAFKLLAGERRLRALKAKGETTVPANVFPHDITPEAEKKIEFFENKMRKDFTPAEEARITADLHKFMTDTYGSASARDKDEETKKHGWRLSDTAQVLGVSIGKVSGDIDIAQALEHIPELANEKTRAGITRKVNKILKEAVLAEAAKEVKAEQPVELKEKQQRLINSYIISDFFAVASQLSPGTIHFMEVDPPYGIDLDLQKGDADYIEVPQEEYPAFIKRTADALYRIAANDAFIIFWHDPYWEGMIKDTFINAGFRVKRTKGLWIKNEASNQAADWNLTQYWEQFYVITKGSPKLIKAGRSALFQYDCVPAHLKYHKTERPIRLIENIIETFCPPDGRIIVPFLGSGKTLLAAANTGRVAIGTEISEKGGKKWKGIFERMVIMQSQKEWGHFHDNKE